MRFLLIALTFSASAALAQTTGTVVLTSPNTTEETLRVPKEPCDLTRTINWQVNTTGTICGDLEFWFVTGTSCPDTRASDTPQFTKVTQSTLATTRSATFTFKVQDLPAFTGTNAVTCPAADREDEYRLCAAMKLGTAVISTDACSTTSVQKDDLAIIYDAKPPSAPTIENVAGLDKALSVRVSPPDDASEVKLVARRPDGTGSRELKQSVDQPLFRLENLENGVTYTLTATALDSAGNESADSEAKEGTPIPTRGFFDRYVEAGGQETGGCGAAAGSLAGGWVLAVLGFWLSSRRNRS